MCSWLLPLKHASPDAACGLRSLPSRGGRCPNRWCAECGSWPAAPLPTPCRVPRKRSGPSHRVSPPTVFALLGARLPVGSCPHGPAQALVPIQLGTRYWLCVRTTGGQKLNTFFLRPATCPLRRALCAGHGARPRLPCTGGSFAMAIPSQKADAQVADDVDTPSCPDT